jgi:IS30 family transposase
MRLGFLFKKKKYSKLTPEQRKEIHRLHQDGMSTYKIAKKFGIRQSTAHYWANLKYRESRIEKMRMR